MPHRESQAIEELEQNTNINVKISDKGNKSIIMNKEDKLLEGQALLEKIENYESLASAINSNGNICKSQGAH